MLRAAALLPARRIGPAVIVVLVAGYAILWFAARPAGQPTSSYVGQFCGAEAVLLLSIGLVLISTLPLVETWFDGIDRAAIWHRRVAISGVVLLIPHIALSVNRHPSSLGKPLAVIGVAGLLILAAWAILPRWRALIPAALHGPVLAIRDAPGLRHLRKAVGGYERWRSVHRATGLFVAAGFVHGLLDGTPFPHSQLLRWTLVAIGGTGLVFYVYREVLARHFVPVHDYQVESVRTVGSGITEIALAPLGRPVGFAPGQFAMLFLEGKDGWHRHPFTMASSPEENVLRFAIKALGDDTAGLRDFIKPGMPAVIGGPFGRFSHEKGTARQLWIAGGIGVTPFLSWLRALDSHPLRGPVDFFYLSSGADIPYAEEIAALADRHDMVHVHFVNSSSEGHLSTEHVMATIGGKPCHALGFPVRPGRHGPKFPGRLSSRRCGQPLHIPRVFRLAMSDLLCLGRQPAAVGAFS
jgi:predicted ferric reductase